MLAHDGRSSCATSYTRLPMCPGLVRVNGRKPPLAYNWTMLLYFSEAGDVAGRILILIYLLRRGSWGGSCGVLPLCVLALNAHSVERSGKGDTDLGLGFAA